jgi:hypothetical protein
MMSRILETLFVTLLLGISIPDGSTDSFAPCLPKGTALAEVVSTAKLKSATGVATRNLTLQETLRQIKAHCKKGKLVDGAGREIRFYRLLGCWGNPPEDYQEQLARQNQELQRLKKKYTVVEIPCAQTDPRLIQ